MWAAALALGIANGALAASSVAYASAPAVSTVEPSVTQIEATAATATSLSPLSDVKGAVFDRFYMVWGENVV